MKKQHRIGGKLQTAAAFALGATAGSLATLVCAPESGPVFRRHLAHKAQGVQRKALRQLGKTKRLIARQADQVRDAALESIDQARDWVVEKVNGQLHLRRPLRRSAGQRRFHRPLAHASA